jgi:hypothetical protein
MANRAPSKCKEIAKVRATTRLKNMVRANEIVVAPGAFDGLSACPTSD